MINKNKSRLIKQVFVTNDKLYKLGVVRSTKIFGDIAEYLCKECFSLTLVNSQNEIGYDATDVNNKKYQIKFNNSSKKTNQDIGDITKYDYLLFLLTENSLLYDNSKYSSFIIIFKIPSSELISKSYIGKQLLSHYSPTKCLSKDIQEEEI